MGKLSKRLVSIITGAVVATSLILPNAFNAKADTTTTTATSTTVNSGYEDTSARSIKDGVMLHAWNWSFN